jgi:hypothetical protein
LILDKRKPDETKEQYRARLRRWNADLAQIAAGQLVWVSTKAGTYVNPLRKTKTKLALATRGR